MRPTRPFLLFPLLRGLPGLIQSVAHSRRRSPAETDHLFGPHFRLIDAKWANTPRPTILLPAYIVQDGRKLRRRLLDVFAEDDIRAILYVDHRAEGWWLHRTLDFSTSPFSAIRKGYWQRLRGGPDNYSTAFGIPKRGEPGNNWYVIEDRIVPEAVRLDQY